MKILATADSETIIAEVTRTEIKHVFNNYGGKREVELKPGMVIDLSAGYRFTNDIQYACQQMREAMVRFEKARATMMAFAVMVSNLPQELQPDEKDGVA